MTEHEEFYKIYGLEVVAVPPHRPMIREDDSDLVYRDEPSKFRALIKEIGEVRATGRPVLVGTVSVEKSEVLSEMLRRDGIAHEVLNAKLHEKEAPIVAQAGHSGAVTIATNMAGRGTDILLGGNPAGLASEMLHRKGINPAEASPEVYRAALDEARRQCAEDHERVVTAGGLHIIGTERHDSRRIDNQLRGRAGRQGDPGSSRFYLSLEDPLLKRFAGDRVAGLMSRLGLEDDMAIESGMVSKTIESSQTRVEGFNFDMRKRVVEFDDVINKQRETIYAERDKVLHNEDLTDTIRGFVDQEIDGLLDEHLAAVEPDDWDVEGLSRALQAMGFEPTVAAVDALWEAGTRAAIEERLRAHADELLERKEAEYGPETWALVERLVLLRTIDSLWVEHLTELDDMRRGIGLRGYSGEDPLNAFRKVAFELYEELRGFIQRQVATTIFRVSVTRQPATTPLPGPGQPSRATDGDGAQPGAASATDAAGSAAKVAATASATAPLVPGIAATARPKAMREQLGDEVRRPAGATPGGAPKIGRNDPCHCGSGLKYKKCHGR
jgi:preprotein translocase subunit SecA